MTEILLAAIVSVFSAIAGWGFRRLNEHDERLSRLERKTIWK